MNEPIIVAVADGLRKLAELIRAGSQSTKKCIGAYIRTKDGVTSTCAIGAAAWQVRQDEFGWMTYENAIAARIGIPYWYELKVGQELIPDSNGLTYTGNGQLANIMVFLNDDLGMAREAIADWVDGLAGRLAAGEQIS